VDPVTTHSSIQYFLSCNFAILEDDSVISFINRLTEIPIVNGTHIDADAAWYFGCLLLYQDTAVVTHD